MRENYSPPFFNRCIITTTPSIPFPFSTYAPPWIKCMDYIRGPISRIESVTAALSIRPVCGSLRFLRNSNSARNKDIERFLPYRPNRRSRDKRNEIFYFSSSSRKEGSSFISRFYRNLFSFFRSWLAIIIKLDIILHVHNYRISWCFIFPSWIEREVSWTKLRERFSTFVFLVNETRNLQTFYVFYTNFLIRINKQKFYPRQWNEDHFTFVSCFFFIRSNKHP